MIINQWAWGYTIFRQIQIGINWKHHATIHTADMWKEEATRRTKEAQGTRLGQCWEDKEIDHWVLKLGFLYVLLSPSWTMDCGIFSLATRVIVGHLSSTASCWCVGFTCKWRALGGRDHPKMVSFRFHWFYLVLLPGAVGEVTMSAYKSLNASTVNPKARLESAGRKGIAMNQDINLDEFL